MARFDLIIGSQISPLKRPYRQVSNKTTCTGSLPLNKNKKTKNKKNKKTTNNIKMDITVAGSMNARS
jgi:hypothetical protein